MSGGVTALYRKYRSAVLGDLIGQEPIVRTLSSELRLGQLAHAYLLAGIRGTGKTSTARILARAVNCFQPVDGEPCNRCAACTEILDGSAVDVLEIDAASNRGIDEMRELRERVRYLPARLKVKVYIIDEAHMLTTEAWNAFLKTLEEPPAHVLFILCTTEPHKVPETVRSRVQRFDFQRVAEGRIEAHLGEITGREGAEVEAAALHLIATAAQGSVRDALSLLDQCLATGERPLTRETCQVALGLADPGLVAEMLRALGRGEAAAALRSAALAFDAGSDPRQLLRECARLARSAELRAVGFTDALTGDTAEEELCRELAASRGDGFWLRVLEEMGAAELELRQPVDPRLQVEACLLRLCRDVDAGSEPAMRRLEARIAEVEERVKSGTPALKLGGAEPAAPVVREARSAPSTRPPTRPPTGHPPEPEPAPAATGPGTARASADETEAGSPAAPAAPAPPGRTAAALPPPAEPLTSVPAWQRAWPALIDAVNQRDRVFAGVLRGCRPLEADAERLVIGAPYDFHLKQIRNPAKTPVLERSVEAVAGGRRAVVAELSEGSSGAAGEAAAPIGPNLTDSVLSTFEGSRVTATRLVDRARETGSDARE
jgi:DNA polymerase-3 subunit gamma/tau